MKIMNVSISFVLSVSDEELSEYMVYAPCVVVPLFVICILVVIAWFKRRRAKAWRVEAQRMGFVYLKEDLETRNELIRLTVFSQGRNRQLQNVLKGEANGTTLLVGDYSFATGVSKDSYSGCSQTICVAVDEKLGTPHFFLRRQVRLFDYLAGGQDIDFADDPEFSTAFVLQGDDRKAVETFFVSELRQFFVARKDNSWLIEVKGPMIVVHNGKRIKPSQTRELIEMTLEVVQTLKRFSSPRTESCGK
jgi:hypothetical protein